MRFAPHMRGSLAALFLALLVLLGLISLASAARPEARASAPVGGRAHAPRRPRSRTGGSCVHPARFPALARIRDPT